MKNSIRTLVAIAALSVFTLTAQAQSAVKILVVDIGKLYETHYKTVEFTAKLDSDRKKIEEEVSKMNAEGNALVAEYKEFNEASNNPALTADAKSKAASVAAEKLEVIRTKQREIQEFMQTRRNSVEQGLDKLKAVVLDEIRTVVTELGKKKGATFVFDKSGPTTFGISNLIYSDPACDITGEVMEELKKDRPSGMKKP